MNEEHNIPVTSLFFREIERDLRENFHPRMQALHDEITTKAPQVKAEVAANNWVEIFTGDILNEPVLGVDASTVSHDYGEISTALGVGVVSSTHESCLPKYFYRAVSGTSSETFNKVASYIRVAQELAALRYARSSDCWVLYDGNFTSLNWDLCKFAAAMPNDSQKVAKDRDFLEWELLEECYQRCLLDSDSDWFNVFAGRNGQGADRLISISKKGISKYYAKRLKCLTSIIGNAFLPSDKLILGMVLEANEYTKPLSYEVVFEDSHGSNVAGYGKPSTGKNTLEKEHQRVEQTFKNMRVVCFRPWAWSPVMTIHYNKAVCKLEEVLGIIKAQTQTRSIMEPMPLYLADLLSKQAAGAIKLYGEINVGRYPNLFRAFRTSARI